MTQGPISGAGSNQPQPLPTSPTLDKASETETVRLNNGVFDVGKSKGSFFNRTVRKVLSKVFSSVRQSYNKNIDSNTRTQQVKAAEKFESMTRQKPLSGRTITVAQVRSYLTPPKDITTVKAQLEQKAYQNSDGSFNKALLAKDIQDLSMNDMRSLTTNAKIPAEIRSDLVAPRYGELKAESLRDDLKDALQPGGIGIDEFKNTKRPKHAPSQPAFNNKIDEMVLELAPQTPEVSRTGETESPVNSANSPQSSLPDEATAMNQVVTTTAPTVKTKITGPKTQTLEDVATFAQAALSTLVDNPMNISFPRAAPTNSSEEIRFKALYNHIGDFGENELHTNKTAEGQRFQSAAKPKYKNIFNHKGFNPASKKDVHCTTIDMPNGKYIASQGATKESEAVTLRMMAENKVPVSVGLVNHKELNDPRNTNTRLGPTEVGQTINYDGVDVELTGSVDIAELNVRIDQLKFNGQTHFRINEMGWEDKTAGNPARLAAISMLVEQLRTHPDVVDRFNEPVCINCNAGVGRTGTLMTLNDSTRAYLQTGQYDQNLDSRINNARHRRQLFVQTSGQYNTLTRLHQNLGKVLDPIRANLAAATPKQVDNTVDQGIAENIYVNVPPRSTSPTPSVESSDSGFEETPPPVPRHRTKRNQGISSAQLSAQSKKIPVNAKTVLDKLGENYTTETAWSDISSMRSASQLKELHSQLDEYKQANIADQGAVNYLDTLQYYAEITLQRMNIPAPKSQVDNPYQNAGDTRA